jgi:hypothetical protein
VTTGNPRVWVPKRLGKRVNVFAIEGSDVGCVEGFQFFGDLFSSHNRKVPFSCLRPQARVAPALPLFQDPFVLACSVYAVCIAGATTLAMRMCAGDEVLFRRRRSNWLVCWRSLNATFLDFSGFAFE